MPNKSEVFVLFSPVGLSIVMVESSFIGAKLESSLVSNSGSSRYDIWFFVENSNLPAYLTYFWD